MHNKANTKNQTAKIKIKKSKTRLVLLGTALVFALVFYGLSVTNTPETEAANFSNWNAGRIIDDSIFYNPNTMSAQDIQDFLNRESPACDTWGTGITTNAYYPDGSRVPSGTTRREYARVMRETYSKSLYHDAPYVCIQDYYENPETGENNFTTGAIAKEGMISAAQIIYDAAQEFSINPQVLLVMLRKESYVWGDNWPTVNEYDYAMGYGCPDTAACNQKYKGFYNQISYAAWQLNYYREHPYSYQYRPYATNNVYYSPNLSCGTKSVYLENMATTSLYIYTPYTPNDAALRSYPGTGDGCSSYGNRNFYAYFTEWFGSTLESEATTATQVRNGEYYIKTAKGNYLKIDNGSIIQTTNIADATVFKFEAKSGQKTKIFDVATGKALSISTLEVNPSDINVLLTDNNDSDIQDWILKQRSSGAMFITPAARTNFGLAARVNEVLSLDFYDGEVGLFYLVPKAHDLEDGTYKISPKSNPNLVLDLWGGVTSSTTNVNIGYYQKKSSTNDNQSFNIKFDQTTGFYKITSTVANISFDVSGGGGINGTKVIAYSSHNGCNQKWAISQNADDTYTLQSGCSLKTLDVPNGLVSSNEAIIWPYNGGENQKWILQKIEESVPDEDNLRDVEDGVYKIMPKISSTHVLDIKGGIYSGMTSGNICYWQKKTSTKDNQTFNITYNETSDTYSIYNDGSGLALDVSGGAVYNGVKIIAYKQHGGCNQRWKFEKSNEEGYFYIHSACAENQVLDVPYGIVSGSNNVTTYAKHGGDNQKWKLIKM